RAPRDRARGRHAIPGPGAGAGSVGTAAGRSRVRTQRGFERPDADVVEARPFAEQVTLAQDRDVAGAHLAVAEEVDERLAGAVAVQERAEEAGVPRHRVELPGRGGARRLAQQ